MSAQWCLGSHTKLAKQAKCHREVVLHSATEAFCALKLWREALASPAGAQRCLRALVFAAYQLSFCCRFWLRCSTQGLSMFM